MKRVFAIWFLMASNLLWSQSIPFYFQKVSTEQGLSHNKVNCILQDKRGFVWIGTEDGLNRYDGHNFLIFRKDPGSRAGISGNIITDLVEDKEGVLWIATTDGGLCKYDYRLPPAHQFKRFFSQTDPTHFNNINSLLDLGNHLWLATSGSGVVRFNKKAEKFDKPDPSDKRTIMDLCLDSDGIIWVGRQGGGLLKINPVTLRLEMDSAYQNLYAQLPHVVITSIFKDRKNRMWFGSWDKLLYCYDSSIKKELVYGGISGKPLSFGSDEALSFSEDLNGKLWIGTKNQGVFIYSEDEGSFLNLLNDPARNGTISDNRVNCIYKDRSGIIWLGTNKGISKYVSSQQRFIQQFVGTSTAAGKGTTGVIFDLWVDEGKDLWVGTNYGLFKRRKNATAFEKINLHYLGVPLQITKFYYQKLQNKLYLGTDYSLFEFNPIGHSVKLLPNTEKDVVMNKIISSRVVSVVETKIENNPVLLVSPYGHFLTYYDLKNQKWVSRADSSRKILRRFNIKDNLIRKLVKSSNGKIWLATAKEGLGEWKEEHTPKITFYKNEPGNGLSISSNSVYDIAEDFKGNLWISTYGGGLNYFDIQQKEFSHVKDSKNLLEGLALDKKGNVWMISNGNLYKYNPSKKTLSSYHLPDTEKSGGVRGHIYKDNEGYFYLSGANYFIQFRPEEIEEKTDIPKPIFTDFKIFNETQSQFLLQDQIHLPYNRNFLTINYSSPEYSGSDNIYYSYMMEGLDKSWTEAGSKTFAEYTNLSPGEYVFKVKASIKPVAQRRDIATLRIIIESPFWERWWFYLLVFLVLSLLLYSFYRYRINELLKRQAIRNKIAQDLHDNIGSTLSSIAIYSHVANLKNQDKSNSELESLLNKITNTSQQMIEEMKDIVWAINPRNDSIEKIIQRMESFAKPLLAAKNIKLHMQIEESIFAQSIGMEKRNNLYLIFKEAVNNAIKYAYCKNFYVILKLKHNQVVFNFKDDGVGFDINSSGENVTLSGNGVRNIKNRVRAMNGKVTIVSQVNQGTSIDAEFPIP